MFSIIIPCFNAGLTIKNTLNCLQYSGYHNIEIICIDDASTDNTINIINEYSASLNIKIINNQINKGVSYCRNLGIENASSEYIIFLDSDDEFTSHLFTSLSENIQAHPRLDVFSFSFLRLGGHHKDTKSYSNKKFNNIILNGAEFTKLFLTKQIAQHVCSVAIRRQFLTDNNLKFNENSSLGEDIAFQIKCMSLSKQVMYLAKDYFHYNYNPDSVTNRKYAEKHLSCTQNYPDLHQFFIDHNKNDLLPFLNFYYQYLFFYELRFFLRSDSAILLDTYIKSDTVLLTDFKPSFSRPVFILVILKTLYKLCPTVLFKFLKNK